VSWLTAREGLRDIVESTFAETFLYTPPGGSQTTLTGVPEFGTNPELSIAGIIYRMWVSLSGFSPVKGASVSYQSATYLVIDIEVETDQSAWLVLERQR